MSCWRKSESACPTDPTNNPEREGDRLLSTAIYFSCRLITNLPYLPSARSCKRTNPRLFSIPHFFPQNIDLERIRTTTSLRSGGSLVRSPDSPPFISRIRTTINLQTLTTLLRIVDCPYFLNHKSGPPILGRPLQKKIYKDGEFAKRGPYNYN